MPWEFVPPNEEMNAPNMKTTRTSHRMPNAARVGREGYERCGVMRGGAFNVEDGIIAIFPLNTVCHDTTAYT